MAKTAYNSRNRLTQKTAVRPDGSMTPHEARIVALMADDPTLRRKGFSRELMRYVRTRTDYGDEIDLPGFVPDLFFLDTEALVIRLYEVESAHRLATGKIEKIAQLAVALDSYDDWTFELYVVDVHGTPPRLIDVWVAWIAAIRRDFKPPLETPQFAQCVSVLAQTERMTDG